MAEEGENWDEHSEDGAIMNDFKNLSKSFCLTFRLLSSMCDRIISQNYNYTFLYSFYYSMQNSPLTRK